MNCLVQISTLSGPIFQQPNSSFNYFKDYVQLLLTMLKTIKTDEREAFGIASIIRKLLCLHNVKTEFAKMEENLAKEFLGAILMLTLEYIENSVTENLSYDTIYTDASKFMLEAWLDLINLTESKFGEEIKHHAKIIFERFIECHVTGVRCGEEITETEESEKEANKEQLIIIGFLGRLDCYTSLSHLARVLEMKMVELFNSMSNPESGELNLKRFC